MLYKNGIPIWLILLVYGLRFGITGFITPLFVTISSKFGIAKCILISNIFSIICTYMMLDGTNLYRNIIVFILAMGCMGLSNPSTDALSSKYVDKEHRGRYNIIKESKEDNDLLSSVGQMSLCFTEVVIFMILAILSNFIGEKVFYIIFILSIISTLGINLNIKKKQLKNEN